MQAVVAKVVKGAGFELRKGFVWGVEGVNIAVEDGRIPLRFSSEEDVGKIGPLLVSVGAKGDVREALSKGDGDGVATQGGDLLEATRVRTDWLLTSFLKNSSCGDEWMVRPFPVYA